MGQCLSAPVESSSSSNQNKANSSDAIQSSEKDPLKGNSSDTKGSKNRESHLGPNDDDMANNEKVQRELLQTLKEIPLLTSLAETDQRKLAKQFARRKFKAGDDLMKQGDKGNEFFIIVNGKCKVLVTSEATAPETSGDNADGTDDSEQKTDETEGTTIDEIAELNSGDYCGEQALLKDATRGATVRAVDDTECLVLDQSAFQEIIKENDIKFAKRDAKRMAISAEMIAAASAGKESNVRKQDPSLYVKSQQVKDWLLSCVVSNILFSNLENKQREYVIEEMYKQTVSQGDYLIKQGEEGNSFYVLEKGSLNIIVKDIGRVDTLKPGACVGELALLYNAPRAASVQAVEDSIVWAVDRGAFRAALMEVHTRETSKNIEFLKQCKLLQPLLSSELQLVDQALERVFFNAGTEIFKLGDQGDLFYLVKEGTVRGVAKDKTEFELTAGSFFGERALMTDEPRAATVTAHTDTVCLTLSRNDFQMLLGPLTDIMSRNLEEYEKPQEERKPMGIVDKHEVCALEDFEFIGILGRGAFGTVKLVVDPKTRKSYALKAIRKNQVVELGQQSHILNEKCVMQMLDNRFLVNLRNTYKDNYRVYFLLEACLGGELFTILRKMRSFDEPTARFYAACVVEAFDYMHTRDVIYRDLKPENLVMTASGYLKVTDFGFAKVVSGKTFTLCGTPDYLAPEIVTGQGHGKGVDWWTLGILIYEMLASFPPFFDDEPMMTYRKIIQGKFKFPRYLSSHSKDLVCKFLKTKSTKRYGVIKGGANTIRSHSWFKEFDWDALRAEQMRPPIRPKVKSPDDISNFDHFQEREEDLNYKGDPDLGWDKDF